MVCRGNRRESLLGISFPAAAAAAAEITAVLGWMPISERSLSADPNLELAA